ncbi:MAG: hypothetical protein JXA94_05395 [Parachlamydiales bacterium]|nr:hypothetical protein [Parachlamydiales bacterium]
MAIIISQIKDSLSTLEASKTELKELQSKPIGMQNQRVKILIKSIEDQNAYLQSILSGGFIGDEKAKAKLKEAIELRKNAIESSLNVSTSGGFSGMAFLMRSASQTKALSEKRFSEAEGILTEKENKRKNPLPTIEASDIKTPRIETEKLLKARRFAEAARKAQGLPTGRISPLDE